MLGTGTMGAPMARNLARAGHEVRAWNRTPERARALSEDGVQVTDGPERAVRGAEIALTMLSDTDSVLATMQRGLGAGAAPGVVWAQMSTLGLTGIERCAALAADKGVALVDAPVLGTKAPAEAGELIVLAAGPADAVERCAPVFAAVGKQTVRLAGADGATRLKLVLNHWILGLVENVAETIGLAEGLGVDPRQWLATIAGGPLDVAYAQLKGKAILDRALEPSFRLALARKDAGLVLDAAARHDVEAALVEVVRNGCSARSTPATGTRTWPRRTSRPAGPERRACRQRAPAGYARLSRAAATRRANSARCTGSAIFSGCHWTPTTGQPATAPAGSSASISPPAAVALTARAPGSAIAW